MATETEWVNPPLRVESAAALARSVGLSESVGDLLWQRGLQTEAALGDFLAPRLRSLDDPFRITHLQKAVRRVRQAMERAESVLIFGDYDVDGVTSTVFLLQILRRFGLAPRYVVPHRIEEGYGLNSEALERAFAEEKPDLLIAADCGTSAREVVAHLRAQGVDVLILDHHTSKEALPEDCILVNPHVFDASDEPWTEVCTVGLVFKFVHGLLKSLRADGDQVAHEVDLREYLDLTALGTLADLVPLRGENRIFAAAGLRAISQSPRLGLAALIEISGLSLDAEISPFDVAFRLGPRINACGRLNDASAPIELLLSTDWSTAQSLARTLDELNKERQEIERVITAQAEAQIQTHAADAPAYLLHHPDWHAGVVGIVASKVAQEHHRPTLVFAEENGVAKGSGRSVEGVDLVEVLKPCADLLESWGGHPMAVGLACDPKRLEALRAHFQENVASRLNGHAPTKRLRLSAWVEPGDLTEKLLRDLDRLAPFGQGHPEPIFALRNVRVRFCKSFGHNGKHLRFAVERSPGQYLQCVGWNAAETPPPENQPVDLAGRFHWNTWQGRKQPRFTLVAWR